MPQITWKNIDAPDFSAAMKATDTAGDRLNQAFNPLEQALKDKAAIDDQNYETTTKNNDIALRDRIRQVAGLGELNQLDEADLIAQARQRFGNRFSEEGMQSGIAERRGTLQNDAVNAALPDALDSADTSLNITDGLTTLRQKLAAAGMRPEEIQKRESEFLTNNAARERQYGETRKLNVRNFLDSVPTPKTEKEMIDLMSKAQNSGIPMDLDYLKQALTGEKSGALQDINQKNAQADRAHMLKQQAEAEQVDKALSAGISALDAGGDLDTIISQSGDLTGDGKLQLFGKLKAHLIDKESLLPQQALEVKRVEAQNQAEISKLEKAHSSIIVTKEKELARVSGVSTKDIEMVQNMQKGVDGIVKIVAKEASDGHVLHLSTFSGQKDGNAAIAAVNAPYMNMLSQNIPEDIAGVIAVKAYRDVSDKVKSGLIGQDVIPATAYANAVNARVQQYLDAEELRTDLTNTKNQSAQELEAARNLSGDMGIRFLQQTMKSNRGGPAVTRESLESSASKDTSATLKGLVDSSPLYTSYTANEAKRSEEALRQKQADLLAYNKEQAELKEKKEKEAVKKDFKDAVSRHDPSVIGNEKPASAEDLGQSVGKTSPSGLPVFYTPKGFMVKGASGVRRPTGKEHTAIREQLIKGLIKIKK